MEKRLLNLLAKRKENDTLRELKLRGNLIDFSSNDYLGLATNSALLLKVNASYLAFEHQFLGSGGSRLLAGNHPFHQELESYLASFHKGKSALLFNSGYVANLGVFSTIPQKGDIVIYDEYIHACIKDGVRLSNARHYTFKHNDLESLKKKLALCAGKVYVAVESIYSMDGDQAPLKELVQLSIEYGFDLIVDEAHSTGIYGKGAGLCVELGIEEKVFARIHTFGKAIGAHGACVVGSEMLKQFLINFSRSFIYTTSQPLHGLVAIHEAYQHIETNPELIQDLKTRIQFFKSQLKMNTHSNSPIQPVILKGSDSVKEIAQRITKKGFDVRPVLSPTVPAGTERLRVCIHSHNSMTELQILSEEINKYL